MIPSLVQPLSSLMIFRTTNDDGRCPGLVSRQAFVPGMYKLRFETGSYWEEHGHSCFHPYVEVSSRKFFITSAVLYVLCTLIIKRFELLSIRESHAKAK